jgi:methylphosphotriester-DNA--protein-cysteine methyltransferase
LFATLHDLKERATFRIDLRDLGVNLSQSKDYWVRKFFEVILEDHQYLRLSTMQEIANMLDITPVHLERSFKKDGCPMTPKQILLCLKNYYAAYLLDTTSWSTKKIAQRCGFSSEHDFYKSFAKKTGMTVKEQGLEGVSPDYHVAI